MKTLEITLSQAIEGYLLEKRISFRPRTLENYGYALDKLRAYYGEDDPLLVRISSRDIISLLDSLRKRGLSEKSLLNVHAVLSSLWTWAVAEEYAGEHVVRRVPAPVPEVRAIVPFSQEDVERMMKACTHTRAYERLGKRECVNWRPTAIRDKAIVLTLLDTGIRAVELCDLLVEHLDLDNKRIKVFGKGAKERVVRFGTRTGKALWRYLASRGDVEPEEPLFLVDGGDEPLKRWGLYRLIRRLGERAGVTPAAYPHRFRHTFAITFLRNGGDVFSLQALMGHSSLSMVQKYLALAQVDTERAHRKASPVDNWKL